MMRSPMTNSPSVLANLTISAGAIISELFSLPQITKLMKALSSTLGILVAVLLYDALLVIISTTLLIVTFRAG